MHRQRHRKYISGGAADVDLTLPTLSSLVFHPDKLDGDIFDQYADEEAWEATLPARFPDFPHYGVGSEIATTVRSFFGRKVYTLANGVYMELDRSLGQQYDTLWVKQIFFLPANLVASFDTVQLGGMWEAAAGNAEIVATINPVTGKWANQQVLGNNPGDAPDVDLPAGLFGAWHTLILRGRNVDGQHPEGACWLDGVHQWTQQQMWGTVPLAPAGLGYCDAYFGTPVSGDRMSLAMWELVPGTNPYKLSGI